MKHPSFTITSLLFLSGLTTVQLAAAPSAEKIAATVILDETGVKNLRIETVPVEETAFEETVFALGTLKVAPGKSAVVSSRVAGRAIAVTAYVDTLVKEGAEVVSFESRQPGNPPPTLTLTAPIGGLVTKVNLVPGQPVSPDDSLVEISDLSLIHAVAEVPEHLVGKLKIGQTALIRTVAFPDRTFTATLAHLGSAVEGQGTLEAAFHVENKDLALRPGMRTEFSIIISKRSDVTSVPRSALLGEPTKRFVYVKDHELKHAFVKTPVVIGMMNDRFVEILEGLDPDDKVVTKGAYSLSFAGGGSVSLKEALDAAHGHEHAADGGELTPEKKAQMAGGKGGDAHGHGEEGGFNLWMAISGVLFVLLAVSAFTKKSGAPAPASASTTSTEANDAQ